MHIWDDALIVEVLDEQGRPCAPGEYGEMTVTSWVSRIGPKVRYRMGDRVAIVDDPCPCGLDTPRMLPVAGRVDDMLRIHGQNLWPSTIDELIRRFAPGVQEYAAIAETDGPAEILRIQLEVADSTRCDDLLRRLRDEFKASVGVMPVVEAVNPGTTVTLTGAGKELKVRRVFDRRETAGKPAAT
jgi:phenylacetate-CoA ligase